MLLPALLLLAAQAYVSTPHTEPPPGFPKLDITITASPQLFPDACNPGVARALNYLVVGATGCALVNLQTRTCDVVHSTHPVANMLQATSVLDHELSHCAGSDHPVPGKASLAELTANWERRGRYLMTQADRQELQALADATGGLASPEVLEYWQKRMPDWLAAGKARDALDAEQQAASGNTAAPEATATSSAAPSPEPSDPLALADLPGNTDPF